MTCLEFFIHIWWRLSGFFMRLPATIFGVKVLQLMTGWAEYFKVNTFIVLTVAVFHIKLLYR